MLPKTLAALSTFFVAVAAHASEPVGAARIQEQVWNESGVHAREFVVRGIKGGAEVVWRVSPRPAGMLVRQFPGAHRVLIAGPAGSYTLTAEVWTAKIAKLPAGWKEGDDVPITLSAETVTATFTLGTPGPTPPPDPGPPDPKPPDPKPPDPPAPDNPMPGVQGLHVLIVFETGDLQRYPSAQVASWTAKKVDDYLRAKGGQVRRWDANVDASGADAKWQAAMRRPRQALPWLIVGNGTTGYEGPAPKNTDELLALLRRFGGD